MPFPPSTRVAWTFSRHVVDVFIVADSDRFARDTEECRATLQSTIPYAFDSTRASPFQGKTGLAPIVALFFLGMASSAPK